MTTNELKKGTRVILANGWFAEIFDNKKGSTRMAKVYGMYTEIGSVYAHDIAWYREEEGAEGACGWRRSVDDAEAPGFSGTYAEIHHTEKQIKHKATVAAMGF